MSLSVAVQMDPIDRIDIAADSTFALSLEAQARGHSLAYYLPEDMMYLDGRVLAHVRPLTVRNVQGDHFTLGDAELQDLSEMDVILMRQDPPFDMSYITATHLLERLHPSTLVVNAPAEVRNAPEKLYATDFAAFMPPTLITRRRDAVEAFRAEHVDIVIKPLFGNGGAGVFHLKPDDENLGTIMETFAAQSREPVMVQRYLPEILNGDKRIILVDGEPVGAVSRIPLTGEARANFHAGGSARKTELTERERDICAKLGPDLSAKGLIVRGDRRDRRLPHRDQRDLAHRHS